MVAPEPASAESTPANAGAEIESSPNPTGTTDPDRTAVTNEGGSEPTKARQRRPRSRVAPAPCEPSSTPTAEALSRAGWTHREDVPPRRGVPTTIGSSTHRKEGKFLIGRVQKPPDYWHPFCGLRPPVVFDGARRGGIDDRLHGASDRLRDRRVVPSPGVPV